MQNERYEYQEQTVKLKEGVRKITESGKSLLLSKMNKKRGAGWELFQITYSKIGFRLPGNSQPQGIKLDEALVVFRRLKK